MKRVIPVILTMLFVIVNSGCGIRNKASDIGVNSETETEQHSEPSQEKAIQELRDLGLEDLYCRFLYGEADMPILFVKDTGEEASSLDFYAEENNKTEFTSPHKQFALCDITGDGREELIFKIQDDPEELLFMIGIRDQELICYDMWETHTPRIGFKLYDNGVLCFGQTHTKAEEIFYKYDENGAASELLHFGRDEEAYDQEKDYDFYFLNGDESRLFPLKNNNEYEMLVEKYIGGEIKWYDCGDFKEITVE